MKLWDVTHEVRAVTVERRSNENVWVIVSLLSRAPSDYGIATTITYTVWGNGFIQIRAEFIPESLEFALPKLGLQIEVPEDMEYVEWYGRGPHENYRDRKTSADVGRYKSTVTDMFEPYVRPQDMANRGDVRWLTLTDRKGDGWMVVAEETFEFSAMHFTAADLMLAEHSHELTPRKETILCIDAGHHGLGGASCGPPPLAQHTFEAVPTTLSFSIRPYNRRYGDAARYARQVMTGN
jgi:beta-galactosidase